MPRYCGAFWMATGSSMRSMTARKKARSWLSSMSATGGGWSTSQLAPRALAARANSTCPATEFSATVTLSGTRP